MDIQFIEEKYRDDIFKLMELCGVQMAEAYQLYTNAGCNFEAAMNMHFNGGATNEPQQPNYGHNYGSNSGLNQGGQGAEYDFQNNPDLDQFDVLYEKYKIYKQGGQNFESRYEVKRESGLLGGLVSKFWKGNQQSNYKKNLQKYLGKHSAIQFAVGSLSNTLITSDKFPVIVYLLDFSPAARPRVEDILRNSQFIEVANVQFKNFGIDSTYQIQKSLVRFVDPKRFNNSLVVLRVNVVEEIETIQVISLVNLTVKQVLQKLKLAKNNCISKDLDDGHLERRLYEQMNGNFDYQKPMSIVEKRKVTQDRQIRKKQQQEFYASMKAQQQKQRKNSQENQIKTNTNTYTKPNESLTTNKTHQDSHSTQNYIKKQPQAPKRNIAEERKKIREKLRTYTSGMNIKLRLPGGEAVVVTIDPLQKAKYLYEYVEGIEGDIGFQKDTDRKFDIIRPYDKLNLSERLNQTLKDIFEGSESQNLAVRERD